MSTADELLKLDALRRAGALTQEEFDAEKAKLLRGGVAPPSPDVPVEGYPESSSTPPSPAGEASSAHSFTGSLSRKRRIVLGGALVVVVVVAGVLAVTLSGGSTDSPASAVNIFDSSFAAGHQGVVCASLLPSERATCNAALRRTVETSHLATADVRIQGNRGLVVTTGTFCIRGFACHSNPDPNLGFDQGKSFAQMWAIATGNGDAQINLFVVPAVKQDGKWYVDIPAFQTNSSIGPTPTTTEPTSSGVATEANLENALTGAKTYFTLSDQSYAGLETPSASTSDIAQIGTGLRWVTGSTESSGPSYVSAAVIAAGSGLVITAFDPSSGTCLGILDLTTALHSPVFTGWSQTAAPGTYFFLSVGQSCAAKRAHPDALSASGWPS